METFQSRPESLEIDSRCLTTSTSDTDVAPALPPAPMTLSFSPLSICAPVAPADATGVLPPAGAAELYASLRSPSFSRFVFSKPMVGPFYKRLDARIILVFHLFRLRKLEIQYNPPHA